MDSEVLKKMENRLRQQARDYLRRSFDEQMPQLVARRFAERLVGHEIRTGQHIRIARDRILRLIASEKRCARRNPDSYDINRHIALVQALNSLEMPAAIE